MTVDPARFRATSGRTMEQLRESAQRGARAAHRNHQNRIKDECRWGHEFTPETTVMRDGFRHCRVCERERGQIKRVKWFVCAECRSPYSISDRRGREVEKGRTQPICPFCRSIHHRPIKIKEEHYNFWLNGGNDGTLRWSDLLEIAAGLEAWFEKTA